MRYPMLCLFLLTFNILGFAQQKTQYFDENFRVLPGKAGAAYYVIEQFTGKKNEFKTETTYYITGEKLKEDKYVKAEDDIFLFDGVAQKWYKNGQLFYTTQYRQGEQEGEALGYYPSGKLKRRENFVAGKLTKGECFNEDGTPAKFVPHLVSAQFPGGSPMQKLFIRSNLKYPADALRNGRQGTVVVKISIDKAGKMASSEVVNKITPALAEEALRVVRAMPSFEPALEEGLPTATAFLLPIRFSLDGRRTPPSNRNLNRGF